MFTLTHAVIAFSAFWFQTPVGPETPAVDPTATAATATATAGTATAATAAAATAAAGTPDKGVAGFITPAMLPLLLGVVAGVVLLLILIVLAARIFGRRDGRHARSARGAGAVAAGAAAGEAPAAVLTGRGTGASQPVASQSAALQPAARWLVRSDGQKVLLNKLPLNIGRGKTNQLVIDHPSLADVHARIYLDETEKVLCIEDASEGNSAVLVNGSPTRKNILTHNDRISLGDVTLQYQEAAAGQNAAAKG